MSENTGQVKAKKPFYKKWWFIAIVIVVVLVGLTQLGSGKNDAKPTADAGKSAPAAGEAKKEAPQAADSSKRVITLKATCDKGTCTANWGNLGSNNSEKFKGTFEKTIENPKEDDSYFVNVTGDLIHPVKVTCEALLNGESKEKNEGSGEAADAHCQINPWE